MSVLFQHVILVVVDADLWVSVKPLMKLHAKRTIQIQFDLTAILQLVLSSIGGHGTYKDIITLASMLWCPHFHNTSWKTQIMPTPSLHTSPVHHSFWLQILSNSSTPKCWAQLLWALSMDTPPPSTRQASTLLSLGTILCEGLVHNITGCLVHNITEYLHSNGSGGSNNLKRLTLMSTYC